MKKRVISILLLVIVLFGFETIPVMAISVSEIEEDDNYLTFSEETLKNRIFDDIDFYSDVIAEYGDVTSLRISESYAVQNSGKDTFITFIFDNSSCIGYLTVTYNDGKYYSSISFDNLDYVYGYFIAGRPIYVRCMQSQVNSYEYLSFLPANEQNQGQIIELERYNLNIITTLADYTSYYIERNVVSVSNESVNGVGICWAACVAALSNYRNGTTYTAKNIYDAMDEAYLGTPAGNTTWYNRAFNYVGLHCSSIADGVSYLTVYNQLNSNNNPPIFSVYSSEDEVSHAILCKAVKGYSTGIKFGFMDPNYSTTTYTGMISQPSDPSKFVYTTPSGRVYDVWKYYRYSII